MLISVSIPADNAHQCSRLDDSEHAV